MTFERCPYDATLISAEAFSGGSLMLTCERCGAAWEAHNSLIRRVIEPRGTRSRPPRPSCATTPPRAPSPAPLTGRDRPAPAHSPRNARVALLREREHRLGGVGGAEHQRLRDALELERVRHRHRQRLVQQPLRDRQLDRRERRRASRRRRRPRRAARRPARPGSRGRSRPPAAASTDSARKTSSFARCRPTSRGSSHEPPKSTTSPRFEKISMKRAALRRDHDVAPEREVAAGAGRDAVDRRDRRLRQLVQPQRAAPDQRACTRPTRPRPTSPRRPTDR